MISKLSAILGFLGVCAGAELGSAIAALIVGLSSRRIQEEEGPAAWRSTLVPPAGSNAAPPAGAFSELTSQPTLLSQFTLSSLGGGGEVENQRGAESIDMTTGAAVPSAQPELGGRSLERAGAQKVQAEHAEGGQAVGSEAPHAAVPRPDDSRSGRDFSLDGLAGPAWSSQVARRDEMLGGRGFESLPPDSRAVRREAPSVSSDPRRLIEPMGGSPGLAVVDRWKLDDAVPSRAGRRSSSARPLFSPEPPEAA